MVTRGPVVINAPEGPPQLEGEPRPIKVIQRGVPIKGPAPRVDAAAVCPLARSSAQKTARRDIRGVAKCPAPLKAARVVPRLREAKGA